MEFMDLDTWKSLNLPLNLFNLLMRHIKQIQSSNTNTSSNTNNSLNSISVSNNKANSNLNIINTSKTNNTITNTNSNINNQSISSLVNQNNQSTSISLSFKNKEDLRKEVFSIMDSLVEQIGVKETYESTLKTLYKIIENVVNNPKNEQFKRIKKSSNAYSIKIKPWNIAENFLSLLGFQEDSEFVYINNPRLEDISNTLFYFESYLIHKSKLLI